MTTAAERGAVEAMPLAMLTFIVGALVLAQAWAVVAARDHAAAAARDGARAYVEGAPSGGESTAIDATRRSLRPFAGSWQVDVAGFPGRCRPVTVRVRTRVPLLRLPWVGPSGAVPVEAAHTEVVDPYRAEVPGLAACDG